MSRHQLHSRMSQSGRTLLELLVALVIGLVILGSVLLTSSNATFSGRGSDAQAQLNDDAQTILAILTPQLRMAGYSSFVNSADQKYGLFDGPGVRGCDNGFKEADAKFWSAAGGKHSSALICNTNSSTTTGPSISILYEADGLNTVPAPSATASAALIPTDCLGSEIPAVPGALSGKQVRVAENRFFLTRSAATSAWALECIGSGYTSGGSSELVQNIDNMTLTYGVASVSHNTTTDVYATGSSVIRYMTQAELDADTSFGTSTDRVDDPWRRVLSVRLCVTVRSAAAVADAPTPYEACDGSWTTPSDRFLRKTVQATVALRNRIGT